MPAALDLKGKKFGALTVILKTGRRAKNLQREPWLWLCRCDCGREEELPQFYLPTAAYKESRATTRYSCSVCKRGPCSICGGAIETKKYWHQCSDICYEEHRRHIARESYYRRFARDPLLNIKNWKKFKQRMDEDENLREKWAKSEQERSRKRRETAGDTLNAIYRKNYHKNREKRIAKAKENFNKKSDLEKMQIESYARQYRKEYWQKNKQEIIAKRREKIEQMTEAEREIFIQQRRRKNRESRLKKKKKEFINEFFNISQDLINRSKKNV